MNRHTVLFVLGFMIGTGLSLMLIGTVHLVLGVATSIGLTFAGAAAYVYFQRKARRL